MILSPPADQIPPHSPAAQRPSPPTSDQMTVEIDKQTKRPQKRTKCIGREVDKLSLAGRCVCAFLCATTNGARRKRYRPESGAKGFSGVSHRGDEMFFEWLLVPFRTTLCQSFFIQLISEFEIALPFHWFELSLSFPLLKSFIFLAFFSYHFTTPPRWTAGSFESQAKTEAGWRKQARGRCRWRSR